MCTVVSNETVREQSSIIKVQYNTEVSTSTKGHGDMQSVVNGLFSAMLMMT